MKTYAFIPARGNSKRVPGKNFKLINGKPLIYYTIKAALESNVDQIFLTTEDSRLAEIANDIAFNIDKSGKKFNVINRHPKLSQDHVQNDEVSCDLLRTIEESPSIENPDALVMLQPTSPLRDANDINNAIKQWNASNKQGCLVSGYRLDGFLWSIGGNGVNPVNHEPRFRLGKQWIENPVEHFVENGSIYITSTQALSMYRIWRMPPYQFFEMPKIKSVDIDTKRDFNRAVELISYL